MRDSVQLEEEESYSPETQELRAFLKTISDEHVKNSDSIFITSSLNSDNSQTTGNQDTIDDIELLLPSYDEPVQEYDNVQLAAEHQDYLAQLFSILNPDFFTEDPKMFLGDYDAYFKIVKKRSILFFYVSRIILYLTLFFLIY